MLPSVQLRKPAKLAYLKAGKPDKPARAFTIARNMRYDESTSTPHKRHTMELNGTIESADFIRITKATKARPTMAQQLKKAARKWVGAKARAADKAMRERFARFLVVDTYGTCQLAYTMRGAMEWLPYCSPDARIVCAETGALLRQRVEHLEAA
jgi:hypothetical protein